MTKATAAIPEPSIDVKASASAKGASAKKQKRMAMRPPEIDFVTINLHRIRTALWPAPGSDKPPLLFFNGIGGNLEMAQPMADHLMGDRPLIAFDIPGTGESAEPRFPYRPWWIARVAKALIRYWGFDGQVDVFGVSWGGGAAQQFAIQYRQTTRRLVLAATSAGVVMVPGNVTAMRKMADNRRYVDPNFLLANYEAMYGDKDPTVMKDHALRIIPPTKRGYMFQLAAMAGWTSAPFLPFLGTDTLVMAGDSDRIVPLANGKILASLIPNAELDIIEGGGHLFMLSEADYVINRLNTFLDRPTAN